MKTKEEIEELIKEYLSNGLKDFMEEKGILIDDSGDGLNYSDEDDLEEGIHLLAKVCHKMQR